jgi:hypothetical protein
MGEGRYRPEGAETPRRVEAVRVVPEVTPELIINISEADLLESQSSFAIGRGFKTFGEVPPIERAEFWTRENGVENNYLEAEKAAIEAGLDRKGQLDYKIKALEARMSALSRSDNKGDIKEFHSLDEIGSSLRQELTDL